jgi:hypothetical protein
VLVETRLRHGLDEVNRGRRWPAAAGAPRPGRGEPRSALAPRLRARLAAECDDRAGGHAASLALMDDAGQAGDPFACAEMASLSHHCVLDPAMASCAAGLLAVLDAEVRRDRPHCATDRQRRPPCGRRAPRAATDRRSW